MHALSALLFHKKDFAFASSCRKADRTRIKAAMATRRSAHDVEIDGGAVAEKNLFTTTKY
jgi:hypothetical protein